MKQYEVGIIGGGLAGMATSIEMAKRGYKVILWEKRNYPYHKVCGEYLSMESWNYLKALGMDLKSMDLPKIDRLMVSNQRGAVLHQTLGMGGFGISRYSLDAKLAELARKAGVEVMEACRIESSSFHDYQHIVNSREQEFRTRLLVAAYGKRSHLDKAWNRNFISRPLSADKNFTAVKYHIKADLPKNLIGLHIFDGGYAGISKVEGKDRYSLCYMTLASSIREAGGIPALEEKVLSKNSKLKEYLKYPRLYDQAEVIAQLNFNSRSQIEEHCFMMGDAAGLIVPLCGNGMSMALRAAHLWSALAANYLKGSSDRNRLEREWQSLWRQIFNRRMQIGRMLQSLFYRPSLNHLAISALNHFPSLTARLISMTHGEEILKEGEPLYQSSK